MSIYLSNYRSLRVETITFLNYPILESSTVFYIEYVYNIPVYAQILDFESYINNWLFAERCTDTMKIWWAPLPA